ncbi:GNAT family N-acetyltransferase [Phyllobacterium sp. LjRoot231]|uniref:GNAT family N-acetyltransferase n=1 Tax=Phyllobacterium sp. LjRoot231 TaxID=3342289 RepID=UPI003ED130F9
MQSPSDYLLRTMQPADLAAALSLSSAVNWPHRIDDWRLVASLGHGTVAEDGSGIVGTIHWWPFGNDFATLGMVIVSAERQRRGIGGKLMDAALTQAEGRNILLIATKEGEPLYKSLGFRTTGAISQHQGRPANFRPIMPEQNHTIRPFAEDDTASLISLDSNASGLDRRAMLSALLRTGQCIVLERSGQLDGYAILHPFGRGYVVGPVIAPNLKAAQALISNWISARSEHFLRVDTPDDSGLGDWLEAIGLPKVGGGTTMVRGNAPQPAPGHRIFTLTNQALG